jgi:hypothetical protein
MGQNRRNVNAKPKEQLRDVRYNEDDSGYSEHLLDTRREYGNTEDAVDATRMDHEHLGTE